MKRRLPRLATVVVFGVEGAILEPKDLLQSARTGIDLETWVSR
jgi:hypothetical protein